MSNIALIVSLLEYIYSINNWPPSMHHVQHPNTQTYILSNVAAWSSILPLQIIAQLKGLDIVHLSNYRHLSRFNWWTFDTESDLLVIWKSQSITLVSGHCCSTTQGSLLQWAHSSPVPVTGDHCASDTAPAWQLWQSNIFNIFHFISHQSCCWLLSAHVDIFYWGHQDNDQRSMGGSCEALHQVVESQVSWM